MRDEPLRTFAWEASGRVELACSRRLDSRAREKNSRRKKTRKRLEGERGNYRPTPQSSPLFPGVQFNSLPTDRRVLLSERMEQARMELDRGTTY